MNRPAFVMVLALAFVSLSAQATVLTYDPNGTGGWQSASRFKEKIAPQAGDRVNISGGVTCTAVVSQVDLAFVNSLSEIVLFNKSTLKFDIPNDAGSPYRLEGVQLHGQLSAHSGGGLIVKAGAGELIYGKQDHKVSNSLTSPCRGFLIEGGVLELRGNVDSPIDVRSPGRLRLRSDSVTLTTGSNADFSCKGLNGDGVVSCDVARQFCFGGGTAAEPNVFSGTFEGSVMPSLKGGYQYLTNASAFSGNVDIRLWQYVLGITHFGSGSAAGTLGTSKTFWTRGNPTRVLYLGQGETTDRNFYFNSDSGEFTLDGGATGGLIVTGSVRSDSAKRMCEFALDGSNTVECVLQGPFVDTSTSATYVTKRGTGIWKLGITSMSDGGHGAFSVENGILRYISLAEAGHNCALGYSDRLYEAYSGSPDENRKVSYAIKLGDGADYAPATSLPTNSATLSYCGPSAVLCNTRPIALAGAGRLRNETGYSFLYSGVTSQGEGDNALVLDADSANNLVRNVTNGTGRITVVKEGSGTWTVAGDKTFSGIEVRQGTLKLTAKENYTFFRFASMDTRGDLNSQLAQFCLWDDQENLRSANLAYRSCVGDVSKLNPGEVTDLRVFQTSGGGPNEYAPRGRTVENLFTNDVAITKAIRSSKDVIWSGYVFGKTRAALEDESTWPGFICRIPEGTAVTHYDIQNSGDNGTSASSRQVMSWKLEGSVDGRTWVPLHTVISNATKVSAWAWYAGKTTSDAHVSGEGYPIAATNAMKCLVGPISVGVNEGASLVSDAEVTVNEIVYDVAKGGGSLDGFAFAANGTFRIVNAASDKVQALDLPMAFGDNVSGRQNVANWSVVLNGKAMGTRRTVSASETGFRMSSSGLVLIVR